MKTMAVFISFVLFCVCLFVYLVEDIRKEFVQTSDYGEVKASFAGPRISWFLNKKRLMRNADKYLNLLLYRNELVDYQDLLQESCFHNGFLLS